MNIFPVTMVYNTLNNSNLSKTNNFSPKLQTLNRDCVSFGMAKLNLTEEKELNKVYTKGMINIFRDKLTFNRANFNANEAPSLSYEDLRLIENTPEPCIKKAMNMKLYGEEKNVSAFRAANQEGFRWFAKRKDIDEIALNDLEWQKAQPKPHELDTCLSLAIIQDAFTEVVNALKPSTIKKICKFDSKMLDLMDADNRTVLLKKLGERDYKSTFGKEELKKAKYAKTTEMFVSDGERRVLTGSRILKLIEMGKFDILHADDQARVLLSTLSMQENETLANYEPKDGRVLANKILDLALYNEQTSTIHSIQLINLAKEMQVYCAENGGYFNFENPAKIETTLKLLTNRSC